MERIGAILVLVLADVEDRIAERKSRIGAAVGVRGHGKTGEDCHALHAGNRGRCLPADEQAGSPSDDTPPANARFHPKSAGHSLKVTAQLFGWVIHDASIPTMAAMNGIAMQATTVQ